MQKENKLWWKHGTIYQIYPRSFQDSNGDGVGDLKGIISRLDYLKDLGVDALWLSPINPSPDADFGYDVADYKGIDPKFGSMDEFETLLEEAHSRGLKLIMDLVLNHSSNQHPWFIEAKRGPISPYHDYYIWRYPRPKYGFPNNWRSIFGGPAWTYEDSCGKYYYHIIGFSAFEVQSVQKSGSAKKIVGKLTHLAAQNGDWQCPEHVEWANGNHRSFGVTVIKLTK